MKYLITSLARALSLPAHASLWFRHPVGRPASGQPDHPPARRCQRRRAADRLSESGRPISAECCLRAGGDKRNPDGTVELTVGADDGQEIPDTEKGKVEAFYRDTATGAWVPLLDGVTIVNGEIHIIDPANNNRALRFYQIRRRP